ncbi:MAG: hypothetical protein ACK5NF_04155 [Bacilli bacterium]
MKKFFFIIINIIIIIIISTSLYLYINPTLKVTYQDKIFEVKDFNDPVLKKYIKKEKIKI